MNSRQLYISCICNILQFEQQYSALENFNETTALSNTYTKYSHGNTVCKN